MNRRRSMTLYADTIEDYISTAIAWSPQPIFPSPQSFGCRPRGLQIPNVNTLESYWKNERLKSSQGSVESWSCAGNDSWIDFDHNTNEHFSYSLNQSKQNISKSVQSKPSKPLQLSKSIKIMVLGCRGTYRHALVNNLFNNPNEEDISPSNQVMDLILKTEKTANQQTKYQFWLRTIGSQRYESLVRVYHRRVRMFIFVYRISDEQTFKALDESIQSVLEDVPTNEFNGILIGIQEGAATDRKVSYNDGITLKEKYCLKVFLETTTHSSQEAKEKILNVLNSY